MSPQQPTNPLAKAARMGAWYARRPQHLPHFFDQLRMKLTGDTLSTATKPEATAWCEERAVSPAEAIAQLTNKPMETSFAEAEADLLAEAQQRAGDIDVPMGGAADMDLLYHLIRATEAKNVIETGVAHGWSSLAALAALRHHHNAQLVSVDLPYGDRDAERFVGHVVPTSLRDNWTLISRADRQGLPKALRMIPHPDLAHYDSDKAYPGRMWSYARLWDALNLGGVLISDDAGDNLAFRDFCDRIGVEPIIVRVEASSLTGAKHAGILRKPRSRATLPV